MSNQTSLSSTSKEQRKLRRIINRAMTGAALGAGLLTVPALAANYVVNTTSDSPTTGQTSLRQAITSANADGALDTITFDPTLGTNPTFALDSPLPSVTNSTRVTFDLANVGVITLQDSNGNPSTLSASGSGKVALQSSNGAGANAANGGANAANGVSSGITANTVTNDDSTFTINNALTINGGRGGAGGGDGGNGGDFSITGNTVTNDNSSFSIKAGAGGNAGNAAGGNDGGAGGNGGSNNLMGNVTTNNGSSFTLNSGFAGFGGENGNGSNGGAGGNNNVTGDSVTANDSSIITLSGGNGQFAPNTAGGVSGSGGTNSITSNTVVANGTSQFILKGGAGGGGFGVRAGISGTGGNNIITADTVTANDSSGFTLQAGSRGFGPSGGEGGNNTINAIVIARDSSTVTLNAGTGNGGIGGQNIINGNIFANDTSTFNVNGTNGGTATANVISSTNIITGDVTTNDSSTIQLTAGAGANGSTGFGGSAGGNNSITGNTVTNDNSTFALTAGAGGNGGNGTNGNFFGPGTNGGAGGNGGSNILTGDVTAKNSSSVTLISGVGGNAGNDGNVGNSNPGGAGGNGGVGGNNTITGNLIANNFSLVTLIDGAQANSSMNAGGINSVTGNANFNDRSVLRNQGANALNTVGNTTTTFGQNATFAPYLDFTDPTSPSATSLTVNNLTLNNSLLQPYLTHGSSFGNSADTFDTTTPFTVLHYNGDLNGMFDTPAISPLTFDVNYTAQSNGDVQLQVTGIDFRNVRGNDNQRSLENYLNNFVITGPNSVSLNQDDLPFILADLTEALSQNGPNALNFLIPDNYAAHSEQTYLNQKSFIDLVAANMRNDRNMTAGSSSFAMNQSFGASNANAQLSSIRNAMDAPVNRLGFGGDSGPLPASGVWAAYNRTRVNTDADSGVGSRGWDSSSDGYAVGYTGGGDSFSWGIAGGHEETDLDFDGGTRGEVDGYNGALYAAWTRKSAYLNAIVGYGRFQNDANTGSSDTHFKSRATSGYLELGKHLRSDKRGGLTPYASLLYSRIRQDDVTDNITGLRLNGGSNNVTTGTLGIRYNHRMYDQNGSLKGGWQAGLAYLHQFGNRDFEVQGNYSPTVPGSFSVQTTPLDSNAAQVNIGAYGRIHGSLIGFLGYQGTFGSNQNINAVNAGIGYKF